MSLDSLRRILRSLHLPARSCCCCTQNKDPASLRLALQQLLGDQGLSEHSDARAIARVKAQLERQRDLEGIDMSNIIEEDGGRGSRRRAAAKVEYK